jgi:glucosamine 6-phosphate synthetase-like amidotransferase/phosphosugar isomerase protein
MSLPPRAATLWKTAISNVAPSSVAPKASYAIWRADSKRLIEVPRLMAETLALEPQIEELARDLAKSRHMLYLGRGTSYPLATPAES